MLGENLGRISTGGFLILSHTHTHTLTHTHTHTHTHLHTHTQTHIHTQQGAYHAQSIGKSS